MNLITRKRDHDPPEFMITINRKPRSQSNGISDHDPPERAVLQPRRTTIDYLYDFGDSWEHRLTVTNIRQADPAISYPRYIGGEWNGPPEDCGGIPGFYDMLDAVADPKHPNHDHAKEWLDDYDPNNIDELQTRYALSRIANRRNAAKTRTATKKSSP